MKPIVTKTITTLFVASLLGGCVQEGASAEQRRPEKEFEIEVDPKTFEMNAHYEGQTETISQARDPEAVQDYKETEDRISWVYPDSELEVTIGKKSRFVDVSITSLSTDETENEVTWPNVSGNSLILPFGEGKRIPADDETWRASLEDEGDMDMNEAFSMPFYASEQKSYAILYLPEETFNNKVSYQTDDEIQFQITHEYPTINDKKTYRTRIYVADNNPADWATIYKNEKIDNDEFQTLAEKEKNVPDIKKLYGAPHIYFWNDRYLTETDVNWRKLKQRTDAPIFAWTATLLDQYGEEGGDTFRSTIEQLGQQDYVDAYQKAVLLKGWNLALQLEDFYQAEVFPDESAPSSQQSEQARYQKNKELLASALGDAVSPVKQWGKRESTTVMKEMKQVGIDQAWIGLPNWVNGLMQPDMVQTAANNGYAVGPYDSYHSIHEKPDISWNTASFPDKTLFEQATIRNKNGEYVSGFLGRGRKLNPTLSLPIVKQRVTGILADDIPFNSWFMDTDATGEVYDDYSPDHTTTQKEDWGARLERMDYLAKEHGLIVGSEGGNDFASRSIAYAHGIETPVIKWSDPDMRENEDSDYFVGKYYTESGGVPERYSKPVPIKDEYYTVYIDPAYSLPLYKLVYNDAVITSHHWEWGSLKITGRGNDRKLKEYLYNVPPLYHVDANNWDEQKEEITTNSKTFSSFHKKAVQQPMTSFEVLSNDRLVQSVSYGDALTVVANFSDNDYATEAYTVKAHTALIIDENKKTVIQ